MSTTSLLPPGVTLRPGADRRQTRIGWRHGLIWQMHATLSPAASI